MTKNFSDLDSLTFEQKQQLLMLISALIESADAERSAAYDSGDKAVKIAILQEELGLTDLRHEIVNMRAALQRSPSIRTSSLIEPVLRYINKSI